VHILNATYGRVNNFGLQRYTDRRRGGKVHRSMGVRMRNRHQGPFKNWDAHCLSVQEDWLAFDKLTLFLLSFLDVELWNVHLPK